MGGLSVDFPAAGDVATVYIALTQVSTGRSEPIGLLTVGAVASGAPGVAARRPGRRHLRQRRLRQSERGTHGASDGHSLRGQMHRLVRVLQQMLPRRQQVARSVGQRVAQRWIISGARVRGGGGGGGGVHAGHGRHRHRRSAHVQPTGLVHVPPGRTGVETVDAGVDGVLLFDGGRVLERPRFVRVRVRAHVMGVSRYARVHRWHAAQVSALRRVRLAVGRHALTAGSVHGHGRVSVRPRAEVIAVRRRWVARHWRGYHRSLITHACHCNIHSIPVFSLFFFFLRILLQLKVLENSTLNVYCNSVRIIFNCFDLTWFKKSIFFFIKIMISLNWFNWEKCNAIMIFAFF